MRRFFFACFSSLTMALRFASFELSGKSGSRNPICAVEMTPMPPSRATCSGQAGQTDTHSHAALNQGESSGFFSYLQRFDIHIVKSSPFPGKHPIIILKIKIIIGCRMGNVNISSIKNYIKW